MSQYATIDEFKMLGLPPNTVKNVENAVLNAFLTKASGKIDSFLRGQYSLPLTSPYPDEIVMTAICLARYMFMVWRGYRPDEFDDEIRKSYEDCLAWLKMIQDGTVSLDGAADNTPSVYEGAPRVNTKANRGWHEVQDCANYLSPDYDCGDN